MISLFWFIIEHVPLVAEILLRESMTSRLVPLLKFFSSVTAS